MIFFSTFPFFFLILSFFLFSFSSSSRGSRGSQEVDSRDALLMEKEAEVNITEIFNVNELYNCSSYLRITMTHNNDDFGNNNPNEN